MRNRPKSTVWTLLLIAAWFGLFAGLVEGISFLILQSFGRVMNVWLEIVWIAPLVNLVLFILSGLILAAMSHVIQRQWMISVSIFGLAFLTFLDWLAVILALTEMIQYYAVVILAVGLSVQFARLFHRHQSTMLRFWQRTLPWLAALVLLAGLGIESGSWLLEQMNNARLPRVGQSTPNVVVIVIDALRADHLAVYDYERATSPNIDQLAREGTLFENAISTASYTLPSHASLLTGRYPHEHGAQWTSPRAVGDSTYPTLSEALRSKGYRTGGFSANTYWFTREQGFGRGFIHFEDYFHSALDMFLRTLYGRSIERFVLPKLGFEDIPARKRAEDINRSVLRWLERDNERPFFVFLNYMDVHDPYLPPQPYRDRFSQIENAGGILNWRLGREDIELTATQTQSEIDAYDGAIAYMDDQLGQLISGMHELGVIENTMIVITSDHGEAFGEHEMFLHAKSLYLEELHVPLILWWPGRVPADLRISHPVSNAALPKTIMDLLGTGERLLFPGRSLRELWNDSESIPSWPFPLAEMEARPWVSDKYPVHYGAMRSILDPRWHYIEHETLGSELYEWNIDPQERDDLAEDATAQLTLDHLRSFMEQDYTRDESSHDLMPTDNPKFPD